VKTVILAGGAGTRLAEETDSRPKPMVEIGGRPLLWHIMKRYARQGFDEFLIALGYKGEVIKRYFLDYYDLSGDVTVDLASGEASLTAGPSEPWTVHLRDTGLHTNTGGRIRRLEPWLSGERFLVTYGDGLADVDLHELVRFHVAHGRIATLTAVRPPARFGVIKFEADRVASFAEKTTTGDEWINGGFMVFEPEVFRYLDADETSLEADTLERLAADEQLGAYRHEGFWQCMDSLHDRRVLEQLWLEGDAPWLR
jgi:glucose-1-phosphate cytidylyltransferase